MPCIYALEDDPSIGELIRYTLSTAGFEVQVFATPQALYQALSQTLPALIVLDRMLTTAETGTDVLKRLKNNAQTGSIPVIFLTALSTEMDKVGGLELGADDYLTKPFGVLELIARVKTVLRRYVSTPLLPNSKTLKQYRDLTLNEASKEVLKNNVALSLTYKEYALFCLLFEHAGQVISRDTLLDQVWGMDFFGERRTVDVHIKALRQKLGDNADNPIYIKTIRGHGYMFLQEKA